MTKPEYLLTSTLTVDQRIEAADKLVQEALRMLKAGCKVNTQLAMMEALGHIQAIRNGEATEPGPQTAHYSTVATEHGWE